MNEWQITSEGRKTTGHGESEPCVSMSMGLPGMMVISVTGYGATPEQTKAAAVELCALLNWALRYQNDKPAPGPDHVDQHGQLPSGDQENG